MREFVPGDRQRRINWPATTRRGRLQLNTFAAERTQNVVIIADASSDVGEPGLHPGRPRAARLRRRGPRVPGGPGPGRLRACTSGSVRWIPPGHRRRATTTGSWT